MSSSEPQLPRKPAPDEAQFRYDSDAGHWYIYVEKPAVGRFSDMPPEEFAEFRARILASQPTEEEIRNDRWND